MRISKILIFLSILMLFISPFWGNEKTHKLPPRTLSTEEQNSVDKLNSVRFQLEITEEPSEQLEILKNHYISLTQEPEYSSFDEEAKLILEDITFLDCALFLNKIHFTRPDRKKFLADLYNSQIEKTEKFIDSMDRTPNKWLYCYLANIQSNSLPYISFGDAISRGMESQTFYEKSVEQEPSISQAWEGLGMCLYFTPPIAGGSKKEALKKFEKAVEVAKTDSDKFMAYLFFSQINFEVGDKNLAKEYLAQAELLCKDSFTIKLIKELNNMEISWLQYTGNPQKYNKKLKRS